MAQNENQNIDRLYIAEKETGERVTATEWNMLPAKINEMVDRLNGMPEEMRQLISASLTTLNNVRPMSTAEYLLMGYEGVVCVHRRRRDSEPEPRAVHHRQQGGDTPYQGLPPDLPHHIITTL